MPMSDADEKNPAGEKRMEKNEKEAAEKKAAEKTVTGKRTAAKADAVKKTTEKADAVKKAAEKTNVAKKTAAKADAAKKTAAKADAAKKTAANANAAKKTAANANAAKKTTAKTDAGAGSEEKTGVRVPDSGDGISGGLIPGKLSAEYDFGSFSSQDTVTQEAGSGGKDGAVRNQENDREQSGEDPAESREDEKNDPAGSRPEEDPGLGQSGDRTQIPMEVHVSVAPEQGNPALPSNAPEQIQEPVKKAQEIRIRISKADDFRQFYAIGALGVHNIYDFRISFYNDQPDLPTDPVVRNIQRTIGSEVILSPVAAMELYRWLGQSLAEYEARFGRIRRLQDISGKPAGVPGIMPGVPADSGNGGKNAEKDGDSKNDRKDDFMKGYA